MDKIDLYDKINSHFAREYSIFTSYLSISLVIPLGKLTKIFLFSQSLKKSPFMPKMDLYVTLFLFSTQNQICNFRISENLLGMSFYNVPKTV